MKPLVYISGPFTLGDTPTHVHRACQVWETLRQSGVCTPICPHWSFVQAVVAPISHADWITYDLELVARCDAILRLPGESKGADQECLFARALEIPVFNTVSSLLAWAEASSSDSRGPGGPSAA